MGEPSFMRDLLNKILIGSEALLLQAQLFNRLFLGADIRLQRGLGFLIAAELGDLRKKSKNNAGQCESDYGNRNIAVNNIPVLLRAHGAQYRGREVNYEI